MASQKSQARVVVIGAGVAGLKAATTLRKHGHFDVTLLEAENRIGGRVQTLKLGEHFIENGAQWVHGCDNNSIYAMTEPLKLLDSQDYLKFNADSIFVTQHGKAISKQDHEKVTSLLEKVSEGPSEQDSKPDESLGKWAERTFWDENNRTKEAQLSSNIASSMLDWFHRFQTSIDGSDSWFLPSCKGQQEYWECPGNPTIAWKSPACYASLLSLILYDKPSVSPQFQPEIPPWIHLNQEVTQINYTNEKDIEVQCKDGSSFKCDHVICTVSLGVLKEKADKLFFPPLPEDKLLAIRHLSIGCVNKLHFEFPHKWWPDKIIGFNLLWDDATNVQDHYNPDVSLEILNSEIDGLPLWCRGILGFFVVASHPTALNSWMTGPSARLVETLEDNVVQSIFMKVLRRFVSSSYEIPDPVNFVRSKWYSNPFTRGSYSFRSVDSEKHDVWSTTISRPILKNNSPAICFAGEASHIHFYSTVHGAHDSGFREATRLINFYSEDKRHEQIHPLFPYTDENFKN